MRMTVIRQAEIAKEQRIRGEKERREQRLLNAQLKIIVLASLLVMFTLTAIFGIGN